MNRRGFITGVLGLLAAPAIVRATNIMPIKCFDLVGAVDLRNPDGSYTIWSLWHYSPAHGWCQSGWKYRGAPDKFPPIENCSASPHARWIRNDVPMARRLPDAALAS